MSLVLSVALNVPILFLGMADYQVLPPGLNAEDYGGLSVNPNDFQMKGMIAV